MKGFASLRLSLIHICTHCETALAEAEIEYAEKKSFSIYVKFPYVSEKDVYKRQRYNMGYKDNFINTYLIQWTVISGRSSRGNYWRFMLVIALLWALMYMAVSYTHLLFMDVIIYMAIFG